MVEDRYRDLPSVLSTFRPASALVLRCAVLLFIGILSTELMPVVYAQEASELRDVQVPANEEGGATGEGQSSTGEQESPADEGEAEEPFISLELSPNPVGRGDRFTLTMIMPEEETESIEIDEPELPDAFSVIGGPYIRPLYEIDKEGNRIKQSRVRYVLVSRESGRFEIGSYRFSSSSGEYLSEPVLMEIGLYRDRSLIVPPDISWNIEEEEVYVGQNVVWILEAEGLKDIRIFEDVTVTPPDEGFFEPVDGVGTIVRYRLGGATLYREPVAEYLYTPSVPATVSVPRGLVGFDGLRIQSNSPDIEVRSLPEEVEEYGAVGRFEVVTELDKNSIRVGESLEYRVSIRGTGNLNYLSLPEPEMEGWTIISEEEEESFEAGEDGYSGYRRKIYTISPDERGVKQIRVSAFRALDPLSDTIYRLGGDVSRVEVMGARSEGASAGGDEDSFPFSPMEVKRSEKDAAAPLYTDYLQYLWLLPGPLVFLFFLVLRRRKWGGVLAALLLLSFSSAALQDNSAYAEEGMRAYKAGEWDRAYSSFRLLLEENEYCPEAAYNLALTAYRMGRVGETVFFARSAIDGQPAEQEYRRFLSYIEQEHDLPQHGLFPWPIHPDFILVMLVLALNFAAFIGVIYLFTGKNGFFILAMLLFVFSIALASALGYSSHSRARRVAVAVASDVEVKTIPKNDSSNVFLLREGESAEILGESEPFLFIKTVLGRRGWVRSELVGRVGADYEETFSRIERGRGQNGFRRDFQSMGE